MLIIWAFIFKRQSSSASKFLVVATHINVLPSIKIYISAGNFCSPDFFSLSQQTLFLHHLTSVDFALIQLRITSKNAFIFVISTD